MSTVTWDAVLVTVDGFGFGTLPGESCLTHGSEPSCGKSVHSHKVSAWGGWGRGGGDTIGGGGGRRTENRDHIYDYYGIRPQKTILIVGLGASS